MLTGPILVQIVGWQCQAPDNRLMLWVQRQVNCWASQQLKVQYNNISGGQINIRALNVVIPRSQINVKDGKSETLLTTLYKVKL
jgi:hypothetical protein